MLGFGRSKPKLSSLSPAQGLQQWDGRYSWSGKVSRFSAPKFGGAQGSLNAPGDLLDAIAGFTERKVDRRTALSVPAVLRARNVIAGISSTLEFFVYNDATFEQAQRENVVVDPHPELVASFIYAQTIEDLLFEGVSYWRVLERRGKYPVRAEHIDIRAVSQHTTLGMPSQIISQDLMFGPYDPIYIDGIPEDPRNVIRFVSPNPPLLVHAARAIRIAVLLDQVSMRYSEDPMPLGYFTDNDEDSEGLSDDEIKDVLNQWGEARSKRSWGYVPRSLRLEALQWNSRQIQLVEARTHAVLEIARAAGLDPEDMGVSIQGASRTYVNAQQRRLDLIDFTLMPYLTAVEQRLSKDDILPKGLRTRADASGFLRADLKTRMEAYGLALEHGIMTLDEVRAADKRPGLGSESLGIRGGTEGSSFESSLNGSAERVGNGHR